MALLGPTGLLISEKSATYTIKWSYTIIWQVRVSKDTENCCGELKEYIVKKQLEKLKIMLLYDFFGTL